MSKFLKRAAPFALNLVASASMAMVMLGSLILAPLILAGIWLGHYCAGEALA